MGNSPLSARRRRPTAGPPTLPRYLRRRRALRIWLSVLAAVLLLALVWTDRQGWLLFDGGDMARYSGQTFIVERVIDGDTLVLRVPDGESPTTRVRLWGVNCPELASPRHGRPGPEPWAHAARDRARLWIEGKPVYLELEPHRVRGRYGRILAFVRMPDGAWLNERLLLEGLTPADDRWPHRHLQRYERLETQARQQHRGLWSDNPD